MIVSTGGGGGGGSTIEMEFHGHSFPHKIKITSVSYAHTCMYTKKKDTIYIVVLWKNKHNIHIHVPTFIHTFCQ